MGCLCLFSGTRTSLDLVNKMNILDGFSNEFLIDRFTMHNELWVIGAIFQRSIKRVKVVFFVIFPLLVNL